MKRIILLGAVLPLLLLISACQKNEYVVPNQTIVTDIFNEDWVGYDGGRTYSAYINMPEIDNYLNERGGVLVYISYGDQTYEQIPEVYNGYSYSYSVEPGQIVIDVQRLDGGIIDPRYDLSDLTVKIILMESDY